MTDPQLAAAEDCRELFDLMKAVKKQAPWDWMEETDMFGVQHPETGEISYVSVMGTAGEHYAVSAYKGEAGYHGFWHMQDLGFMMQPEDILNVPQVQASFEDRDMLEKHDYQLIKSLKLKFRGRNAWPQFRSYRPGFAPWFIEKEEADTLKYVLQQLLEVAPRIEEDPEIVWYDEDDKDDDSMCLIRVPEKQGDSLVWKDEWRKVEEPPTHALEVELGEDLYNNLKGFKKRRFTVEMDLFMLPTMIGEKGERPYFPYGLLLVDPKKDMILGFELLSPQPSLQSMWSQISPTALAMIARMGFIPSEINVSDPRLYGMLQIFMSEFGYKVNMAPMLPALENARAAFEQSMLR